MMNYVKCRRIGKQFCFLVFVVLFSSSILEAQPQHGFVDRVFRDASGEHKYVVFIPHNYSPDRKWPVILYLHGAGERGNDGRAHIGVGLAPMVKRKQESFPFVVVFPQCENVRNRLLQGWITESPDAKRAMRILETVEKDYSIDRSREILFGWSMGGYGAWSLAAAMPERWSAVVVLAGGGNPAWAEKLKDIPIWAFHGGQDSAVRARESRTMFNAIKKLGNKIRYTEFAQVGHDVWKLVFDQDELFDWAWEVSENGKSDIVLDPDVRRPDPTIPNSSEAFIPAIEITNVIHARLGNDVFRTLAASLPNLIPEDALNGRIEDVEVNIVAEERPFRVNFTNISYSTELTKSTIKAYKKDHLNVQLTFDSIWLRIGTTYLTGAKHSAIAGPIDVVMGQEKPVLLEFDVIPEVSERRLKLKPVNIKFEIAEGNWEVIGPDYKDVERVRGWGLTRRKVARALNEGVSDQKKMIESKVATVVPSLMEQLEDKLSLSNQFDFVSGFWPLPVYRPRTRMWPQAVSTDKNGVSLVWGITAASVIADKAPAIPKTVDMRGMSVDKIPRETGLRIALTPEILSPLSQLLIDANVGHIHVLDISDKAFAPLADREVLARAIPELNNIEKDAVLWSELVLAAPLAVSSLPAISTPADSSVTTVSHAEGEGAAQHIVFHAPKLLIKLSLKSTPTSDNLRPFAELEFQLSQPIEIQMKKSDSGSTQFRMEWIGAPEIKTKVRFAKDYKPQNAKIDVAQIQNLFADAWKGWTQNDPVANVHIPSVDFGYGKLEATNVGWSDPHLYVQFEPPRIKISNKSDVPLEFEIRLYDEEWSKPQTLDPGNTRDYKVGFPIEYRRKTETGFEHYELALGSHSEYRNPITGGPPQLFQALQQ